MHPLDVLLAEARTHGTSHGLDIDDLLRALAPRLPSAVNVAPIPATRDQIHGPDPTA